MFFSVNAVIAGVRDARHFGLAFPIKYISHAARKKTMRVDIPGFGDINIRPGSSDIFVVHQIFREQVYDISQYKQHSSVRERYDAICEMGLTPIIIDAGANIGAASIWFATKYPKAKVLSVEPDPENADCCRANSQRLGNVAVIEAAIGASSGAVTLTNPTGESWAVQTQRTDDGGAVKLCTIPELIGSVAQGRLLITKIDIEGFESDLFSTNTSWMSDVAAIMIELHDWMLPGQKSSLYFQRAIAQHDFELVVRETNLIYFKT